MPEAEDLTNISEGGWEQVWRQFTTSLNIEAMTRAQWRAVCTAKERAHVQTLLIRMAEAAKTASKTDQLGLYKAAYAVLPLHGAELRAFVQILLDMPPAAPEWADALMLALAEQSQSDGRLIAPLLSALRDLFHVNSADATVRRRANWIACHVRLLGYEPDWLNEPVGSTQLAAPNPPVV